MGRTQAAYPPGRPDGFTPRLAAGTRLPSHRRRRTRFSSARVSARAASAKRDGVSSNERARSTFVRGLAKGGLASWSRGSLLPASSSRRDR